MDTRYLIAGVIILEKIKMPPTLDLSELDEMLGRLFMTGIPGTELDLNTENLIQRYFLGGVILFSKNISDPLQLATLCKDLQKASMKYHGTPLFLAIDQEGGRVARLKPPFTTFPGNAAIGEDQNPIARAKKFAQVTAKEMGIVGLNMNMAPVLDVRMGRTEKHLIGRTFGEDPEKVSMLGRVVLKELQENGVMAVAKHFPGLGRSPLDPHHELPVIPLKADEMEQIDLLPFKVAIAEDVSAVMTSHAIYPAIEPEIPATLSYKILTDLLREKLGFDGLIITDDLEMGAIKKKWGVARGAAESFKAGADILLICEEQKYTLESIELLKKMLLRGEIPTRRIYQSLDRIMKVKSTLLKKKKKISLEKTRAYFGL